MTSRNSALNIKFKSDSQFNDALLMTAQENSPDGILVVGKAGQIISFNQRFIDIWSVPIQILESGSDEAALHAVLDKVVDPESFIAGVKYLYAHPSEKSHDEVELKHGITLERYSAPMFGRKNEYLGRIWYFRDITELKKAEAALKASEERLKIATDSGQVAIWEVNLQTGKLIWDDTCFTLYQMQRENFSGSFEEWAQRLHPDDLEKTVEAFQTAAAGGEEYKPKFRIIWPNGEIRHIEGHGRLVKDEAGQPLRMIGTNWDITELVQAGAVLRTSEERIKIATGSGQVGIWEINIQTNEIFWDDTMFALYGAKREEFPRIYGVWISRVHPEDRGKIRTAFRNALKGMGDYHSEFRIILPNGQLRYIEGHAKVIRNEHDIPIRIIGTNWDNQAHIYTQQQLKLAQTAIDMSRSTFYRVSPTGEVLYANDAACQSLGYSREELLSRHVWEFDPNFPPEAWVPMWEGLRQSKVVNIETLHQRKDGTIFPVEVVGNLIQADGEEYSLVLVQDITERKKSETVLAESEYRLRLLNEISEATRILGTPQEVLATISRLLGMHLHASRCAYADVEADGNHFTVPHDYTYECESIIGNYQLSQFGQLIAAEIHTGRTLVINNIDEILSPKEGLDIFNALAIKAVVCRPLIKEGKLRAMMGVTQTTARTWSQNEIALIEEVVERCWETIERIRVEKERTKLTNIIEHSLSEMLLIDAKTLRITYANDGARRSLGYTMDQLLNMTPQDIKPDFEEKSFRHTIAPLLHHKKEQVTFEAMHRRADGTVFPVEVQLQLAESQGSPQIFAFINDITQRKKADERIQRLSNLYRALSETNQAIVRMQGQDELFSLVCRCAVELGGMKLAWFGQLDRSSGEIMPVAMCGDSQDYVRNLRLSSLANVPEGRGPAGIAFRENKIVIINDFLKDPLTVLWQEKAAKFGLHSGAAFPVQRGGKPSAMFFVYHELTNAFDNETISLLQEISNDIGFALDNFDREAQRKSAEEALILAASVYENSSEAMTITDPDGVILTVNPSFTQITGYLPEDVIGKNSSMFASGRHDKTFYDAMWESIKTTGRWQGEIWDRRKDGGVYPTWLTINTIYNKDGSAYRRISLFSDTTAWKETETLIWQQANFDVLTGLPNRQMFYDRLDQDIKKAHRAEKPIALMFIDLDRFKEINDTLGHDMGDILLKEAAQRLTSCVRETDTVARLGGDEFTVILSDIDDPTSVERVALNILNKLEKPFKLKEELGYISASVGITMYPEDATGIDELIKNADQAMYEAKNLGRNRYSYFTPSMQKSAQFRMQIANDLRSALTKKQFWIAYQPIVKLSDGSIHKAEALVRWKHPKHGLISPAEFIPVAEHTGLITDIGDWVFRESAAQVKEWQETYGKQFQISVNVSPVQINDKSKKFKPWHKQLKGFGLSGKSIIVEITEGLLLEANTSTNEKLLEYRDAGIQVALDDFGTGYSSLSYLKKFDIDYIKIDQAFVRGLTLNSGDMALCEAMIVMAHKLNMLVIAEGVETTEQVDILTRIGCDYAQGYLFSKPVPAESFEKLLKSSNAVVPA